MPADVWKRMLFLLSLFKYSMFRRELMKGTATIYESKIWGKKTTQQRNYIQTSLYAENSLDLKAAWHDRGGGEKKELRNGLWLIVGWQNDLFEMTIQ